VYIYHKKVLTGGSMLFNCSCCVTGRAFHDVRCSARLWHQKLNGRQLYIIIVRYDTVRLDLF